MVAVCGMSAQGEMGEGQPTIVSRVVLPSYRRKGIGQELYKRAIARMRERMASGEMAEAKIRIDHISAKARAGMQKLLKNEPELSGLLEIHDMAIE